MTGLRPTLTINEIKALRRCRREHVEQALATGALRACAINVNRKGRTPGVLVAADEALRWMAAGAPTAPVGAA